MEKTKTRNVIICVIAVLLCGVFYVCANDKINSHTVEENFASESTVSPKQSEGKDSQGDAVQDGKQNNHSNKIYIDISGEVRKAGVYTFDYEPRLIEVIEKAGGLTKKADTASINQAQIVSDGTQIIIVSKADKNKAEHSMKEKDTGMTDNVDSDGKVNINSATKEELMVLNGVGESRANDILSYREKTGNFKKIEEIMNVPGIKEGIFNQIKDKIKV